MRETVISFTNQIIEAAKANEYKKPKYITPNHLAILLNISISFVDEIYKTEFVGKLKPRPTAHNFDTYEIIF